MATAPRNRHEYRRLEASRGPPPADGFSLANAWQSPLWHETTHHDSLRMPRPGCHPCSGWWAEVDGSGGVSRDYGINHRPGRWDAFGIAGREIQSRHGSLRPGGRGKADDQRSIASLRMTLLGGCTPLDRAVVAARKEAATPVRGGGLRWTVPVVSPAAAGSTTGQGAGMPSASSSSSRGPCGARVKRSS